MQGSGERGVALVATLLVVTLLTVLVLEFTYSVQVNLHLARNHVSLLQASYLAASGVNVARLVLKQDGARTGIDSLDEPWARPVPALAAGAGAVAVRITDAMGKLNLNVLRTASGTIDHEWREVAQRLFVQVGVDPDLVDALSDWLDADDFPEPRGAERAHYLAKARPYTPSNAALLTEGELARVEGFAATDILELLGPVVSVLPDRNTSINVNTAPAEVLHAVFGPDAGDTVERLLAARAQAPFAGVQDVRGRLGLKGEQSAAGLRRLDARSRYFCVEAVATVGDVRQAISSLVRRRAAEVSLLEWRPDDLRAGAAGGV